MVGWSHCLNGHEFVQALGDGEGQGRLVCCSPWGRKESGTTQLLKSHSNTLAHVTRQRGATAQHRGLSSVLCDGLEGWGGGVTRREVQEGGGMCIRRADSC